MKGVIKVLWARNNMLIKEGIHNPCISILKFRLVNNLCGLSVNPITFSSGSV